VGEGVVPRVFRTIHSAEDQIDVVDGKTIRLAADTYEAIIRAMDVRRVALQDEGTQRRGSGSGLGAGLSASRCFSFGRNASVSRLGAWEVCPVLVGRYEQVPCSLEAWVLSRDPPRRNRMHPSVGRLWTQYRAINSCAPAAVPVSFHFCDNPVEADLCAALVREGQKRATAPSVAELQRSGSPIPQVGDFAIVTDWVGVAVAVIRTTAVEIKRFADVDEAFARAEGEGDLTLEGWRRLHQAYYERVLAGSQSVVDAALEIVCERFEVVLRA